MSDPKCVDSFVIMILTQKSWTLYDLEWLKSWAGKESVMNDSYLTGFMEHFYIPTNCLALIHCARKRIV